MDSYRAAVAAIVFCAICVAINVATVVAYRVYATSTTAATAADGTAMEQNHRIERRLTLYAFWTFAAQLVVAADMVCIALNTNDALFFAAYNQRPLLSVSQGRREKVGAVNNWIKDICTVVLPAWLMLWASDQLRELMWKLRSQLIHSGHTTQHSSGGGGAMVEAWTPRITSSRF